jgi:hypothetical protein
MKSYKLIRQGIVYTDRRQGVCYCCLFVIYINSAATIIPSANVLAVDYSNRSVINIASYLYTTPIIYKRRV